MTTGSRQDWDNAFANTAHVPGSEKLPESWTSSAANYRNSGVRVEEYSYATHCLERYLATRSG